MLYNPEKDLFNIYVENLRFVYPEAQKFTFC